MGAAGKIGASLDFLQEIGRDDQLVFKLVRPLHIEPTGGPLTSTDCQSISEVAPRRP